MERIVFLLVAVLVTSCSYKTVDVKPDALVDVTNETTVLGPEAFPFCGGWIEIWSRVRPYKPTEILIKATPPAGVNWLIQNSSVIVERADGSGSGEPIRFTESRQYEVSGGKAVVMNWQIFNELISPSGLKVALQPFKGCPSDSTVKGVVLRASFEQTTLGS